MGFEKNIRNEIDRGNRESDEKILKIVSEDRDPYQIYRGKIADIIMRSGRHYLGRYRGLNEQNEIILMPCVINEFFPANDAGKERNCMHWANFPQFLCSADIESVNPVREEYLAVRIGESRKPEIILP